MAQYQTGTAATPSILQGIIEAFCTNNGFTLNAGAGSWLSKGQTHVKFDTILTTTVNSLNKVSTVATATCSTSHLLTTGDTVVVSGATGVDAALYNGTFNVTVTGGTVFTYVMSGVPTDNCPTPSTTIILNNNKQWLNINAANSSDGSTGVATRTGAVYIPFASWPITYYLFYSGTPDQVACIINYDATKIQVLMFGDIVKVNSSAFVGGNWFFASRVASHQYIINDAYAQITDSILAGVSGGSIPMPFIDSSAVGVVYNNSQIHCEIDGIVWADTGVAATNVMQPDYTISSLFRSPNSWNNQSDLIPIHLQFRMLSTLFGYIGYIEHIRFIRIDNYNLGDIITLGTDQWKVFPVFQKDATNRNGTTGSTGTLGFAIRYAP